MRTRHLRGTTDQLNQLNLPVGRIAIDTERKALRMYDGEIRGGFEVLGRRAIPVPGPNALLHGDIQHGFFGELPSTDIINGTDLASQIGLSAGIAFNTGVEWLKFAHKGQILFIPKRPLRYGLSWDQIQAVNAIYITRPTQ